MTRASTSCETCITRTTAAIARSWRTGHYQAIVSYGPEHDAVFTNLEVTRGQETPARGHAGAQRANARLGQRRLP